jgi:hypothetical protein
MTAIVPFSSKYFIAIIDIFLKEMTRQYIFNPTDRGTNIIHWLYLGCK